jgi:hypothetical protein
MHGFKKFTVYYSICCLPRRDSLFKNIQGGEIFFKYTPFGKQQAEYYDSQGDHTIFKLNFHTNIAV